MADDGLKVTKNEAAGQFEVPIGGMTARLVYVRTGGRVILAHTVVPPAFRNRGIGSLLVRAALDDARAQRLQVVPSCWFVRDYIAQNPEYRGLIAAPDSPER